MFRSPIALAVFGACATFPAVTSAATVQNLGWSYSEAYVGSCGTTCPTPEAGAPATNAGSNYNSSASFQGATYGSASASAGIGPGFLALPQMHASATGTISTGPNVSYDYGFSEGVIGYTWTGAATDLALNTFVATLSYNNYNTSSQYSFVDASMAILDSSVAQGTNYLPWSSAAIYGGFQGDCSTPGAIAVGDSGPVHTLGAGSAVVSPSCGSSTFHLNTGDTFYIWTHLLAFQALSGTVDASHSFTVQLNPNLTSDQVALLTNSLTPASSPVGGIPEPASWALMIGGFGVAGAALRRRRAIAGAVAR